MSNWAIVLLNPGDVCRTIEGQPARYIGLGQALFVAQNEYRVSYAAMPKGGETQCALPTDAEIVKRAFKYML